MKQVSNTVLESTTGDNGGGPISDKFIFWGHIDKVSGISAAEILALNKEERSDRFKTFIDFDSGGEHMIVCQPTSYGGQGKFLDQASGFTYPFVLSGVVQITDSNNNKYDVNVWVWSRTSHGSVASFQSL